MSNINPKMIDSATIKEIKELDEFLKAYNKFNESDQELLKNLVIEDSRGKITDEKYEDCITRLKLYTKKGNIPSSQEWAQIRADFREVGNKKIKDSKERLESIAKIYSGQEMIDADGKQITPKQAVENLNALNKKVNIANIFQIAVTIVLGASFFVLVVLLSTLLINSLNSKLNMVVVQILIGIGSLVGLTAGAFVGYKLMGIVESRLKSARDNAEKIESKYHAEITKLQMEQNTAEEQIKRIEAQYGVEILAIKDFSNIKESTDSQNQKEESKTE